MNEQQNSISAASEKPQQGQSALADDMLHGADAIGSFLGLKPRQVYHQRKRLPVFQIGAALCARKSTLLRWITEQEAKAQVERA